MVQCATRTDLFPHECYFCISSPYRCAEWRPFCAYRHHSRSSPCDLCSNETGKCLTNVTLVEITNLAYHGNLRVFTSVKHPETNFALDIRSIITQFIVFNAKCTTCLGFKRPSSGINNDKKYVEKMTYQH